MTAHPATTADLYEGGALTIWWHGFSGLQFTFRGDYTVKVWPTRCRWGWRLVRRLPGGGFECGSPRYAPTLNDARRRALAALPSFSVISEGAA
jgi:hypothetical protein